MLTQEIPKGMFYDILDKNRINLLSFLKEFKKDFYLAGGTGLALQIGHRDSIDFDFFSYKKIDTKKLFIKIKKVFSNFKILKIAEDKDTLIVLIGGVKISFFNYQYKLVKSIIDETNLRMASIEDIGCMKLSAIVGRATSKDYIDLYYILRIVGLNNLLQKAMLKFPDIDRNLILKSLVYFEDIEEEKIFFKNDNRVLLEEIKEYLRKEVKKLK